MVLTNDARLKINASSALSTLDSGTSDCKGLSQNRIRPSLPSTEKGLTFAHYFAMHSSRLVLKDLCGYTQCMKIGLAVGGVVLIVIGAFFLFRGKSAEAPAVPGETEEGGSIFVESLDVRVLESFPVQVHATVRGSLSDACTRVASVAQSREGATFTLDVRTMRPAGAFCTPMLTPFEETVALDVFALPAGTYTVRAGDKSATFTLEVDNIIKDKG